MHQQLINFLWCSVFYFGLYPHCSNIPQFNLCWLKVISMEISCEDIFVFWHLLEISTCMYIALAGMTHWGLLTSMWWKRARMGSSLNIIPSLSKPTQVEKIRYTSHWSQLQTDQFLQCATKVLQLAFIRIWVSTVVTSSFFLQFWRICWNLPTKIWEGYLLDGTWCRLKWVWQAFSCVFVLLFNCRRSTQLSCLVNSCWERASQRIKTMQLSSHVVMPFKQLIWTRLA